MNILETFECLIKLETVVHRNDPDFEIRRLIEFNGGLDALEELQKHPNKHIYDASSSLITKYFDLEESVSPTTNITNN